MPSGNLAVLLLLLTAAVVSLSAARAEEPRPLAIGLFVDMADDILAAAALEPDSEASPTRKLLIAGVPLTVGAHEGVSDGGWHTVAGGSGRYGGTLADGLAMTSTVRIVRADFMDEHAGKSMASATTDFRYRKGRWLFGLQPSAEIIRWDTAVLQQDSVIEGRISRALPGGFSVATTGRYRWREMSGGQAVDREIASGRVGLAGKLPGHARIDMAYVIRQEVARIGLPPLQPSRILNAGPAVALALPLGGTIDMSADYEFTETSCYASSDVRLDAQGQNRHRLGLAATWDVGGEAFDVQFSAAYSFERIVAGAGGRNDARHRGSVRIALPF